MQGFVFAVVVAVIGTLIVAPYVAALALYLLPFALVWWALNIPNEESPKLENVTAEDAEAVRTDFSLRYRAATSDVASQLQRGRAAGVRFIEREDRFENRSNQGQQLNSLINDARARADELHEALEELNSYSVRRFLAWRIGYSAWRGRFKFRFAIWGGVSASLLAVATLEILNVRWPLVWVPEFVRPSFAYAALIGWIAGFVGLMIGRSHYASVAEDEIEEVRKAENELETPEEPEPVNAAPEAGDWQSILKIDADASIEDIKRAYKEAIKACHPDFVANMSENIRNAAAGEATRINGAYAQAREARGF